MEKLPRQVYTSEFRQQAVEMVIREGLGIAEASRRLSLSPKRLTNRVPACQGHRLTRCRRRAPSRGHGHGGRVVTPAAGERRTADGARHPEKVGGVLRQRVMARYAMIKELRREYPVRLLCRVLEVSQGGFHACNAHAITACAHAGAAEGGGAGGERRQTCGAERLQKELVADGFRVSLVTLKTELVHHRRYQTRAEAAREIREYIDLFYNREGRQVGLGYLSPTALHADVHAAAKSGVAARHGVPF
jgi:transposase-like protein